MESRLLRGLLSKIGNFSMDSYEDRLIFQKTIYLMQSFGIDLGYRYNWYLAGPYSPDLTEDGYKAAKVKEIPDVKFKDNESKEKMEKFLNFIEERKNNDRELEILASIIFLENQGYSREEITEEIKDKQRDFKDFEIEEGFKILEEEDLI